MRFRIVILILTLLIVSAYAEDVAINFGFNGGLNIAYMEGSEIDALELKYKNTANWTQSGNVGIRIAYTLKKWLELESGLFFSGNGFEILLDSESGLDWSGNMPRSVGVNMYSVRKITFLEFPLALRLQTPFISKPNIRFFGFGGIRTGVVSKAVEKIVKETVTSNFPNEGESTDREDYKETDLFKSKTYTDAAGNQVHYTYEDFYRRGNVSLHFGFGVEKRYLNVGFFIQGQYVYGLLNFNKLSDKARKELALYNTDGKTSNVIFLGEPGAFFRSIQISTGLNIFIPKSIK